MNAFAALLELTRAGFTAPIFAVFTDLLTGWVLAPGRRTITAMIGMIAVGDPGRRRAHDAYPPRARRRLVDDRPVAGDGDPRDRSFAPTGIVALDCDDTLFHQSGPKVEGAGAFRDAVRSTVRRVVYALGLNLVVLTLRVQPPWGRTPIAIPVNARLHRKNDTTTTIEHAAAMIRELAGWLPQRRLDRHGTSTALRRRRPVAAARPRRLRVRRPLPRRVRPDGGRTYRHRGLDAPLRSTRPAADA